MLHQLWRMLRWMVTALGSYFTIRYFLAALRLGGASGVRCFPRSQTKGRK